MENQREKLFTDIFTDIESLNLSEVSPKLSEESNISLDVINFSDQLVKEFIDVLNKLSDKINANDAGEIAHHVKAYESMLKKNDKLRKSLSEKEDCEKKKSNLNSKIKQLIEIDNQLFVSDEKSDNKLMHHLNMKKCSELKKIIDSYDQKKIDRYHEINSLIKELKEKITEITSCLSEMLTKKSSIDKKIVVINSEIESVIATNFKNTEILKSLDKKILLLEKIYPCVKEYILAKIEFKDHDDYQKSILNTINDCKMKLQYIQNQFNIKSLEHKNYLDNKVKYETLVNEINIYQTYILIMNSNGIPYEILKTYIPHIESEVNQVLAQIVSFTVKFNLSSGKGKNKLKNSTININISYPEMAIYKAQLGSGYEKFVINLALRMALINVSIIAKPNFIVIDEGWNCFDKTNINNVPHIMNYVKTQIDHVIVISHIDQLKNTGDYIININRVENESQIMA